jgi:hypothetical protein
MDQNNTPNSIPDSNFKLDDPRQIEIFNYLKTLVGEGAASFYKDACRHMAIKPPFETTTHMVGHSLREIESALRAVLEGIAEPVSGGDKHKKQIETILKALGFAEDDPIAQAWLALPDGEGLHGMAHRDDLKAPRPVDDEFRAKWNLVNSILYAVLEKFASQYTNIVFKTLDELSSKARPEQADADKVKSHIPNNRVAHERFFNAISDDSWLPLLEFAEFFKTPPAPEKDLEQNGIRHPMWPVLIYLQKVAPTSPDLVAKILSEIPDTENGNVKGVLLETAIKLPKEKRIELIPQIKKWMSSGGQFFSSLKSIELIKSFLADNEIPSALTLSREFLDIAEPVTAEVNGHSYFRDPQPFVDSWHYRQFLQDDFPSIAQPVPMDALILLCELLSKYIDLDRADKEEGSPQDYSYISRPSIEKNEHLGRDDADDSLIDAILTTSVEAIDKNPVLLKDIISELRKQKWPVFNRIALYLISKYPDVNPELSVEALVDTSLIDSSDFDREYSLIANGSSFNLLTPDQKKEIFDFIDRAEAKKERNHELADSNKDQFERVVKMWQRDKLSIFESHLEGETKENYEKLKNDLGDADNPRTRQRNGVFVGPTSDIKAEQIGEMPIEELIETLKTYTPPEDRHGFGPSKEGLGRELSNAVKKDVAHFSTLAINFVDLDPTYVRSYIQGFSEVAQNHIPFDWESIIDLSLWVIEQPREIEGREEKDGWDNEDPHWGWTRRAIITLISSGLNNNVIPFSLYEKVWHIIAVLSEDPNPTPEQELTREGVLVDDAYGLTINTVRGEALVSVVEYGLWVTRRRDELPEEDRPALSGFALFPQVEAILEKHLTDPSIAVRAVYGRYFPWILLLGRDWTIVHMKDIFPEGQFGTPLYNAAWETYIGYVSLYNDVFEVLQDQYLEAVKNIGTEEKKDNHPERRDARLAEHLMIAFWRGKLNTTDTDGLYISFWKNADEETRAHAIDFLGRSLKSLEEPLEDDTAKLLKELWEMRIVEAESAEDKKPYEKEMSAFGWWFASGKLDEDWSIKEFLRSLEITKKTNGDYAVVDRLDVLVNSKPLEAVNILQALVKTDIQQWVLFGSETDLKSILSKALSSSNEEAKSVATALINKLVLLGYTNYGDLLIPSSPPPPV